MRGGERAVRIATVRAALAGCHLTLQLANAEHEILLSIIMHARK